MNMALMRTEPITVFCPVTRRRWIAEQVDICTKWCKVQGLEVLRVEKSLRTPPRIYIKPSTLCDRLEGAVACYERGPHGERRYKMAIRFGCEVRWMESEVH